MQLPALVAIVESTQDLASLLSQVFLDEGLRTAIAVSPELRRSLSVGEAFLRENNPRVVIYDICVPFEENWQFFCRLAATSAASGRYFILTSPNVAALEGLIGPRAGHEIIPKPFDLEDMIQAVHRALGRQTL
jgi:DNA-binding response OmpR family regulator